MIYAWFCTPVQKQRPMNYFRIASLNKKILANLQLLSVNLCQMFLPDLSVYVLI